jgi:penicillin-binding protein 2
MFKRRIQLLLGLGLLVLIGLGLRVLQIQVWEHADWTERARAALKRAQLVDTVRGSVFDIKGRQIALDVACIDACVDYRALTDTPDETWIRNEARRRLRGVTDGLPRAERTARLASEITQVKADIEQMWVVLGSMPGSSLEQVQETRREIVRRVEMRRRVVWYRAYEQAVRKHESGPKPPWYKRWIAGSDADVPRLEQFEIEVGEEISPHPVLRDVTPEVSNYLEKNLSRLPGLVLRSGIVRSYPYGPAGAHVLGHLARVTREDLDTDASEDELKQYLPSDLVGRGGLEGLFEKELRGRRGKLVRIGAEPATEESAPVNGQDVRTTLDIELQGKLQNLFARARLETEKGVFETVVMHGAAVVIDVPTGQVLAMASFPAFDPNTLDDNYEALSRDDINLPLLNRATSASLEPGSTIKPLIGLAAITEGVISPDTAIECNGYLVIGGRQYGVGRCWTMTRFHVGHHAIPWEDPHPTGSLTFSEAVQRSCNIYFENCGDRLGIERLSAWMLKFGLGRPTGIGITEAPGRVPAQFNIPTYLRKSTSWFAGIGQGKVQATPLQMANVAATIARGGVFIRPTLMAGETPEPQDLGLDRRAVRLAQEGMTKVVNTRAGSGPALKREDMLVAGKTGTAQAAPFTIPRRDPGGNLLRDESGRVPREELRLSTKANPNPMAPWYRGTGQSGTDRAHAWFIGFAPAENPQIAFCVLVEYGGGGGTTAAPIARDVVQACIDAGYLSPTARVSLVPMVPPGSTAPQPPAAR